MSKRSKCPFGNMVTGLICLLLYDHILTPHLGMTTRMLLGSADLRLVWNLALEDIPAFVFDSER